MHTCRNCGGYGRAKCPRCGGDGTADLLFVRRRALPHALRSHLEDAAAAQRRASHE